MFFEFCFLTKCRPILHGANANDCFKLVVASPISETTQKNIVLKIFLVS
jgi:hypothetical protein